MKSAPVRVGPDLELLDGGGAKRVAGGQHDARPSARNFAASLPMVVVLPEPLTPATRMTNGFLCRIDDERLRHRRQRLLDFARDHRLDLVGRDRGVMTASLRAVRNPVRGADAEIGANQRVLDFLDRRRVELALGDEIGDRGQRR